MLTSRDARLDSAFSRMVACCMADHSTFTPSQDMGTLLMVLLQVSIQHPSTSDILKYGQAGKIVSVEFDQMLATVNKKELVVIPNLEKLLISTDKGLFEVAVRELDG